MKYLTSYVLQQGEEHTSLLLQQYQCRRASACFACICTCEEKGAARNVTGQLLEWCRKKPWHRVVLQPEGQMKWLREELEAEIREISGKLKLRYRVLVCAGEEVLLLGDGQRADLLGMDLGRGSAKALNGSFQGRLEAGAGILLTNGRGAADAESLRRQGEILQISLLKTEGQAERHLREYLGVSKEESAAILLLAGEEGNEG